MDIRKIDGKWTLIIGSVKITGNSRESLESLFNSFSDETDEDIPNCSHCDYTPCRCKKDGNGKR